MSERRRILFFVPSLTGGGAERVFSILLRHLDRCQFEPHLAVLEATGAYMQDIPADVVVHDLRVSRVRYGLPRMVRLVWKLKPHTILSTLGHLNLGLALCKSLMPRSTRLLVRQAWTAGTSMENMKHPERWNWAYQWLYRSADMILCQSDYMAQELVEHFRLPRKKVVRIYNPIDLQRVWELADVGDNPCSGPGPHIVTAGRLSWEKGYDVLLDAMPEVLRSLPTARLFILGEGPRQGELVEQSRRLGLAGAVHFLGFQQNPWRYFRHADLFVLSSRNDALPNAMLEALALGTPIVATDCPGGIREIQDSDDRVVLVPPEDPGALAEAIVSICKMPSDQRECLEGRRSTLSKFDLHRIVGEYSKLLWS
jgi:glycosyltransferase involved in cell wall biosynthesis